MKPRNAYRTILGLCFVLLFGVALAQQNRQTAEPKFIPAGTAGYVLTGDDTLGAYSFGVITSQPGRSVDPHRHIRDDELWYVLEGQLEFKIGERGERQFVAGPGAAVFGPRGIPHAFRVVGTTPAKFLAVISPAGFEKYMAALPAIVALPASDPARAARLKALREEHGMEVINAWSW